MHKTNPSATIRKLSLVAVAVLASTSAFAEDPLGWYFGGNVGRTRANFEGPATIAPLIGPGFVVNSTSKDEHDTGYKLFGGYQVNRNLAIEGGFFSLGENSYTFNTTPSGSFTGNSKVRGLNLDLVGILPVTDRFSVFGRVGAAYAQNRTSFTNTGAVPANMSSPRASGTNLKIGAGMQYAFTDRLSVRAELERYRIDDPIRNKGHIDMASVGLIYRFGEKARTPVAQAYVAPPVVASPPPPPAPVYVAPPPPPPAPVVMAPAPAPVYTPPERPAKPGRN